jgi:putative chitinase
MLTKTQLAAIFPNAETSAIDAFISSGLQALQTSGILDGANRLFYFLAQLGHESNGLTVREENLNYSASRLMQVWPSHFASLDVAKKYEYKPEQLANLVYGGRMGNTDDGDGYKYRGRGYIQLTGRDTYRQIGKIVGIDLEGNPDLASQVATAPKIACAFWTWKNINPACDNADFTAVTQKINGGTNGLSDRLAWLSKVQTVLAAPTPVKPAPAPAKPAPTPAPTTVPTPVPHTDSADSESLANESVRMAQAKLTRLGFYRGMINGIYNQLLRAALMEFQRQEGLTPTGRLDGETMAELNV